MPNLKSKIGLDAHTGAIGAALSALLGFLALVTGVVEGPSYDWPFLWRGTQPVTNAVIVSMDVDSYLGLGQDLRTGSFDRTLHAQLLRKLKPYAPAAVVFDIIFDTPTTPEADQALAEALLGPTNVVLAGELRVQAEGGSMVRSLRRPHERLGTPPWGLVNYGTGPETVARSDCFEPEGPSIAVALAAAMGIQPEHPNRRPWLNYYGRGAFEQIPYYQVLNGEDEFLRSLARRLVVVGADDVTTDHGRTDRAGTPYGSWLGVQVVATACLNAWRQDWLVQLPGPIELAAVILLGVGLGYGLTRLNPFGALAVACATAVGAGLLEYLLRWRTGVWTTWLVFSGVQVPVALVWGVVSSANRFRQQRQALERALALARAEVSRTLAPEQPAPATPFSAVAAATSPPGVQAAAASVGQPTEPAMANPPSAQPPPPTIPDYTLLKRIGSGAYGEVWLAQDALGGYRAAKVVYRTKFASDQPFAREFRGLEQYAPVSLAYPGLVHILHVGPRDPTDHFYYVMELADDASGAPTLDPGGYAPRNLAADLCAQGRLLLPTCIELGLRLAGALKYLHDEARLVHRDIKPANIIYVKGVPKLADIGLVTGLDTGAGAPTYVGTEGYIPPEGPGSAAADIFGLGKVLYEASMGLHESKYPDLPPTLLQRPDRADFLQLNDIILKACDPNPRRRYPSAARLEADLLRLRKRLGAAPPPH